MATPNREKPKEEEDLYCLLLSMNNNNNAGLALLLFTPCRPMLDSSFIDCQVFHVVLSFKKSF